LRRRYGFPVELDSYRPTLVCGPRIGAIDVPAEVGITVLARLSASPAGLERPAPAIRNPRDTMWTFLVRPFGLLGAARRRRPAEAGITVRERGRRVILPVADNGFGWRWAGEPAPGRLRLPPRTAVLDAPDPVGGALDPVGGADEDRRPPERIRPRACGG